MAYLSGYTKRKLAHWVNNNVLCTSYQIKFNPKKTTGSDSGEDVYLGSSVEDDFDDFRIAKADESTELDQWQENLTSGTEANYWGEIHKVGSSLLTGNASSGQKDVVVSDDAVFAANDYVLLIDDDHSEVCKIDSINTGTNTLTMLSNLTNAYTTAANAKVCHAVYVYYNNNSATISSNIANTMLFGDDFNRADSGTVGDKWTENEAGGVCSIVSNKLSMQRTSADISVYTVGATVVSATSVMVEWVAKKSSVSPGAVPCAFSCTNTSRYVVYGLGGGGEGEGDDTKYYDTAGWHTLESNVLSANTDYRMGIIWHSDTALFDLWRDGSSKATGKTGKSAAQNNRIGFNVETLNMTALIDFVYLRNWTANDASLWGAWGAEETELVAKTSSETGSGADDKVAYPAVTHSRSETGSGADVKASYPPASHLRAEAGAGTELSAILAALLGAETGAGIEGILDRAIVLVEIAAGIEGLLSREFTLGDSGIGVDVNALIKTILCADYGSAVFENSYLHILEGVVSGSDTGAGDDVSTDLTVAHLLSDTGAGIDAIISRALFAQEYPTGAIDLAITITAAIAGAEVGAGVELSLLSLLMQRADSGTGSDASSLLALFTGSDIGAGAEAITLLAAMISLDTGAGVEAVLAMLKAAVDSGVGAEAMSLIGAVGRAMKLIVYVQSYRDLRVYTQKCFDLKVYTSEVP